MARSESTRETVERVIDEAAAVVKPKMRGWIHAGTFPLALVAGIVLIVMAPTERARIATTIYALSACLLFGISAVYHRWAKSPRAVAVLRRLDHANIFLIIAGTYTPLALLLLNDESAETLLGVVWGGAVLGIGFRVLWLRAPRWLYTPLYLVLGWAAVFYLPQFLHAGGATVLTLVIVGGVLYSLGALVYGIKKPNPSPRWFGFHEVFHAFTLAAFVAHYVAVSIVTYRSA